MVEESHIGERFHGIRVEVTEEEHNSGCNMLRVYGYGYEYYENKRDKEVNLGLHDVINIEQENASDFCIDSCKPDSEFELRITNKMFEVVWNSESIRFKILKFEDIDIPEGEILETEWY